MSIDIDIHTIYIDIHKATYIYIYMHVCMYVYTYPLLFTIYFSGARRMTRPGGSARLAACCIYVMIYLYGYG